MILDKKVKVKWSAKNINYYRKKGYIFRKFGEEFTVKIEELPENAHTKIKVQCDYCKEIKFVKVQAYNRQVEKHITKKFACKPCSKKKMEEGIKTLYEQGKIQKGDRFYYSIKENRVKELKKSLEKYGTFAHIYKSGLQQHFANHDQDLLKAIEELGYDHMDLRQVKPNNYWDDFKNVKEPIEDFISLYKRFPTYDELRNELKVPRNAIEKHGGMNEIKKKINFKKDKSLIDNRGDYNRSSLELITANFLIAQGITYKREQKPFSNDKKNLRSDFTLYPRNKKPIHIEIWGYTKNQNSERAISYIKRREEKEKLYEEYGITLISIEREIFKQSYEKIEKELNKIFSKFLKLKLKKVEQKHLIPAKELTDRQLLDIVMKYSDEPNFLPQPSIIIKNESGVSQEIWKRYGNFRTFGEKFNKYTKTHSANFWTEEKVQQKLIYMVEKYGEYYGKDMCKKTNDPFLLGLDHAMLNYGGVLYHRLKLYKHCLENNIPFSVKEQNYIRTRKIRSESISSDAPLLDIVNDALERVNKNKKVTL